MISKSSKIVILALVLSSYSPISPVNLAPPALAKADQQSATTPPDVLEEQINNKSYQVSKMLVRCRPEQIWQILSDYNSAPSIFHTLKKCQLLADKGSTKLMHHEIRPSGLMATFHYDLEVKETGHRMLEWHRVNGDFKEVEGFWKLEPADAGRSTLVTYASYVNGGIFMPQALIKRQFRIDMPAVMMALKNQAETTTQIAARRTEGIRTP